MIRLKIPLDYARGRQNQAFSLVEVIVALGIFAILVSGIFSVVTSNYRNFYGTGDKQSIAEFAKEGIEATRSIRDNFWQDIEDAATAASDNGIVKAASGYWQFSGTSDISGALTRVITVSDVSRDSNDEIVSSGGTVDPNTKKVTVTISGSGIDDYVLTTYLSNWNYKTWEQSDWSGVGDREFWSDMTMASSSVTNISTSTIGSLLLAANSSYSASKIITIDNNKVSGTSNLSNFPVLISTTLNSLKTTSNGGNVEDDNGYDIIFTSDIEGTIQLDHEIESYSSSTGAIVMWVKIPTLDYNDDTVFYMYYGNSDISTSQENVTGVWSSDYVSVWHLGESSSIASDSTVNTNNLTAVGLIDATNLISGKIGPAWLLNGSDEYAYRTDANLTGAVPSKSSGGATNFTVSAWIDSNIDTDRSPIMSKSTENGIPNDRGFMLSPTSYAGQGNEDKAYMEVFKDGTNGTSFKSDTVTGLEWVYITFTYNYIADGSSEMKIYFNGDEDINSINTAVGPLNANLANLDIGRYYWNASYKRYFDGLLDEVRILSTVRDGDWLTTEYNNQSSPETFYYIGNNDYAYRRSIVIDNTKVSGSLDLTNYPLLISTTSDSLKTASHGGNVSNDNGYDIIFSSDSEGAVQLDHEIESYSSSTGEMLMWVKIPTLDYNNDTTIYMNYSSSTIATSQENVSGVWDDGYAMVYHLGEPVGTTGAGSVIDSTGNTSGTPTSGLIFDSIGKTGPAIDFSSGTGISTAAIGDPILTASTTISFWAYVDDYTTPSRQNPLEQAYGGWGTMTLETSSNMSWYFGSNGGNATPYSSHQSSSMLVNDTWVYVTAVRSPLGYTYKWYKNGAYLSGTTYDSTFPVINTRTFKIGDGYVYPFNGLIDEFRVTNDVRSVDWIATEYNNMNSVDTFFSMGTENDIIGDVSNLSGYDTPGTLYSSILDLRSTDKELRSITVEQNIPSGCTLQITAEVSNDITFPAASIISEVYDDNSATYYTSSTSATLNGKRYLRYKVDATACNSNSETPTLYGAKFNYR